MSSSAARWSTLLLALIAACTETTPLGPNPDVIVVHAVLNPTQQVQHVQVARTFEGHGYDAPVSGAVVQLVAPNGATYAATEGTSPNDPEHGLYPAPRYDVVAGAIQLGAAYRLRVTMPTGEVVEGETTAPAAAPVTDAVRQPFDRRTDTLRLAWPRVAGARAYEVRVALRPDSIFGQNEYVTFADTSIALPGTMVTNQTGTLFIPGARYDVVVSAVDANYYEYFSRASDPYTGTMLPTSLRGALGVFGSIVPIMRVLVEVRR